jgi:uncharacterized membrane protein
MKYLTLSIPGTDGNIIKINPPGNVPSGGPSQMASILGDLIQFLMVLGILLSLIYLVWAGANWIMSSGDKQKLASAKQKLIYAIVGLIVIFFSFFLVSIISAVIGINLLSIPSQ